MKFIDEDEEYSYFIHNGNKYEIMACGHAFNCFKNGQRLYHNTDLEGKFYSSIKVAKDAIIDYVRFN